MVASSGDPLGELKGRNPPVPEQVLETRRSQLHLDRPLPERYWHWIRHFVQGDMGESIRGLDVRSELGRRMTVTLRMVVLAIVLAGPLGHRLADYAGHLLLPTVAIALGAFAGWSRFQRAALLEALGSDHLRLARAKGLPRRRVTTLHALRNALAPLLTVVAIDAAGILGGVFVVEQVFSWHGMGSCSSRASWPRTSTSSWPA
jgi:ABC-type dipeptide/oligopeptide/nickel transport system permease component